MQQAAAAISEFTAGIDAAGYRGEPVDPFGSGAAVRDHRRGAEPVVEGGAGACRPCADVRKIIGFRNLLIHGYAMIDDGRVWEIVTTMLPSLRATATALLAELGPPDK
ncbi:HepT-like ribonuclease domain-containing protein [Bradyrhizobium sp. 1]|uniref:HepT-like ribonuclease domain-containing protein n=1 Tax=Bradyrhizobium sp. 1 TaxID=241591 RepID=UPI001FFA7450